jgi:hypothetical protein
LLEALKGFTVDLHPWFAIVGEDRLGKRSQDLVFCIYGSGDHQPK